MTRLPLSTKASLRYVLSASLVAMALSVVSPSANAADLAENFSDKNLVKKFADALADHGIYPYMSYNGEFAANVRGGQKPHHNTYPDEIGFGTILNLDKLVGLDGGWIKAKFSYRHGHSLAAKYINTSESVQQIYGDGQTFRLATLMYMQTFNDNMFNVQVGRLVAKESYFTSDTYCLFQSNALCGDPGIITDNTDTTSWPMPTWGGRLRMNITPSLMFTTGVYEAPKDNYLKYSNHGFYWGTKHSHGVWIPAELKYKTDFSQEQYPTMMAIGGAFDTTNGRAGDGKSYKHRAMVWVQAEKMFWKPDPDGKRGISAFAALGLGTKNVQKQTYQLLGGFHYDGPFASRPDDVIAVMGTIFRHSKRNLNSAMRRHRNYITFEANYNYQIIPGMNIMPNIQYVVHPDGNGGRIDPPKNGKIKNAIVLGTQFTVDTTKLFGLQSPNDPN